MIFVAAVLSGLLASAYVLWVVRVGEGVASAGEVAQVAAVAGEGTGARCVLCGAPLVADADDLLSPAAPGRPTPRSASSEARQ